jgi:hypothetical protein
MTAKEELLAIHNILMCPAVCPPRSADDTYTVGLLKNLLHHWHDSTRQLLEIEGKAP